MTILLYEIDAKGKHIILPEIQVDISCLCILFTVQIQPNIDI